MPQRTTRVSTGSVSGGACPVCGGELPYRRRGPRPTYCRQSCRQRAYELRRAERRTGRDLGAAAASTPPPERVVERVTELPYPTTAAGWAHALAALERDLRTGEVRGNVRQLDAACRGVLDALAAPAVPAPAPRTPASAAVPAAGNVLAGVEAVLYTRALAADDGAMCVSAEQLTGQVAAACGVRRVEADQITIVLARLVSTGRASIWREIDRRRRYLAANEVAALASHARVWIRGHDPA